MYDFTFLEVCKGNIFHPLSRDFQEAKGSFNKLKMNLEHEIKYTGRCSDSCLLNCHMSKVVQRVPGQILDEKTLKKSKKASAKAQLEKDKTVSWILAGQQKLNQDEEMKVPVIRFILQHLEMY